MHLHDPLKKYLTLSVVVHITVVLLCVLFSTFKKPIPKATKITMIRLSRGDGGTNRFANLKDSKFLPQSTLREQKKAIRDKAKGKTGTDLTSNQSKSKIKSQDKVETLGRTADKAGVNINKKATPATQKAETDAMAMIDKLIEQREVDLSTAQAKKGESGQSPWGGDIGDEVDPQVITYYNTLKRRIQKEWVLSGSDYAGGTLSTKIVVLIDGEGNVISADFEKSSGDGSFDDSAMRALKKASPFPIPPDTVKNEALTEGFEFEFKPGMVSGSA